MLLKSQIRKNIRQLRKELSADFVEKSSQKIIQSLVKTKFFISSKHIGIYLPDENEVDARLIANTAEKSFYLPVIVSEKNKRLAYYSYHINDPLIKHSKHAILEPDVTTQRLFPIENLDIILLPLVAFDEDGNRIGRGAGFYDHTLSFLREITSKTKKPLLIGLAYEFQKVDSIFPDDWDVPLQTVITEQKIYSMKD